jgi:hypothetical protein
MTALANSPLFWTGLLAALAALYVLPTTIAVIRHCGQPAAADRPAARRPRHVAAQTPLTPARCPGPVTDDVRPTPAGPGRAVGSPPAATRSTAQPARR